MIFKMNPYSNTYDVIVAGGGHAGCEAALASARVGAKTLIVTINMDHIAQMSCNPAIGGIAKGHVVREIDALGGAMGKVTDASSIQFRMLNSAKGPAVWSPRAQCDKVCYQRAMKRELELHENLEVKQGMVETFIIENNEIKGIITNFGDRFYAKSIVVASGTFLGGKLHYGLTNFPGGRAGDPPSVTLSEALEKQLGLRIGRLKTGTPPRVLGKTIDFSRMAFQEGEVCEEYFSFFPEERAMPQACRKDMPCYMVYTTDETAQVVKANIDKAPLYQGFIKGIGTRYCPSFEDKVIRFPHHEKHLLYLEPEGEFTEEYYINGISTSLPPDVQIKMLHTVPGLGNAVISRYAYAIEYDFVFPDQIERSLSLKKWRNLFLAGQINGTSGYEEAAGQGLMAGLNAARLAKGLAAVELGRDAAYIGVMIDDLVTKEIIEPYRLFTSRAEYRLFLRQDNADMRLCETAYANGLLPYPKYAEFKEYKTLCENAADLAGKTKYEGAAIGILLKKLKGVFNEKSQLPFPAGVLNLNMDNVRDRRIMNQLVINAHYEGYLKREELSIAKLAKLEEWRIPLNYSYDGISGLSNESRTKLAKVAPSTLAQAGRIDGVTPSEIALLQVYLSRKNHKKHENG